MPPFFESSNTYLGSGLLSAPFFRKFEFCPRERPSKCPLFSKIRMLTSGAAFSASFRLAISFMSFSRRMSMLFDTDSLSPFLQHNFILAYIWSITIFRRGCFPQDSLQCSVHIPHPRIHTTCYGFGLYYFLQVNLKNQKNLRFSFCLLLTPSTLTSFFSLKIKILPNHNTIEIKFFLHVFSCNWKDPDPCKY